MKEGGGNKQGGEGGVTLEQFPDNWLPCWQSTRYPMTAVDLWDVPLHFGTKSP